MEFYLQQIMSIRSSNGLCPENVTGVRQFLGMACYYRRFIKDFSKIASSLVKLTKKETDFNWESACEKAFKTLKQVLACPEIMAYPKMFQNLS